MSNFGPSPAQLRAPPGANAANATNDASSGNYSSSVTVEELTSAAGKQPRKVTLQGPSLPFMGAAWGGENSLKTTWYPGNGDEATQQVLGPKEMPSAWQGEWNRTLMGKDPTAYTTDSGGLQQIVDPDSLVNALEDMFRGGQRLRVTWSVQGSTSGATSGDTVGAALGTAPASVSGKKVREGRAKSWNFKYTRLQDVAWEVNFEWLGRGKRTQTVTSVRDGSSASLAAAVNLALAATASLAKVQDMIASNAGILNSATSTTLGQLERLANGPTTLANSLARKAEQIQSQVQQVVGIATTLESQPASVVNAMVNVAKNATAVMNQSVDEFGQNAPETNLRAGSTGVTDLLRSFQYFGELSDQAAITAQVCNDQARALQQKGVAPGGSGGIGVQNGSSTRVGDILAVVVTHDGDTMNRLSQRFYKTPDHAQDICQANRLPWHQGAVPTGTILLIPALRTQQRGS